MHNGVIENYHLMKKAYLSDVEMASDTDTEVIVQLIERFSKEGLSTVDALQKNIASYYTVHMRLHLLDKEDEDTIYVAKNKSPLLVGVGEGFNVVASDAMAMLQVTEQYVELHDQEIVIVHKDSVEIQNIGWNKSRTCSI